MSKFDLEAAKRGEAVQVLNFGEWLDAHFVGIDSHGYGVVERQNNNIERYVLGEHVRMKPKKREMWVFPYISSSVIYTSTPCETREEAEIIKLNFPKPAGDVQAILVEE